MLRFKNLVFLIWVVLLVHGVFHAQGNPLEGTPNSSLAVGNSNQGRSSHAMRARRRGYRQHRHVVGKPWSSRCSRYSYKRYIAVNSVQQLLNATRNAKAGDLIELMPGTYYLGDKPVKTPVTRGPSPSPGDHSPHRPIHHGSPRPQRMTKIGTFYKVHGTPTAYITLCGSRHSIIDASDSPRYMPYAVRIVDSSYVRIAGLTAQRALKAIDVQHSHHCEIDNVLTRYTLQEGIRLRYNSAYNVIQNSVITHTGLMWAGYGEGIYVGTSKVSFCACCVSFFLDS